jgi:hypothetical protein
MTGRQRMLLDNPLKTHSSTISLFARGTSVQRHPHTRLSRAFADQRCPTRFRESVGFIARYRYRHFHRCGRNIDIAERPSQLLERGIYSWKPNLIGFGISNLYRRWLAPNVMLSKTEECCRQYSTGFGWVAAMIQRFAHVGFRKLGSISISGGVTLLMNTGRSVCDLNRHTLSLSNTHSLIKSATIGGFD